MTGSQTPAAVGSHCSGSEIRSVAELSQHLETALEENEALGRELLRSYEQLNLVFEITDHIANLQDAHTIRETLLRRCGTMLGAGALYFDQGGQCLSVECVETVGRPLDIEPERVRAALAADIEGVRRSGRSRVPELAERSALDDVHVLVGALRSTVQEDTEPGVLVALRDGEEPPFDSGDMLASESVLGYGGHILCNLLMVQHLQRMAVETVRALANAIDAKDAYTCGHSERVGWLAKLAGTALDLSANELQTLEWAGLLHDVGKIGIPEGILNKPGKLTNAEFSEMKRHPRMSYEVLKPVSSLGPVLEAVLHHHENYDGSGYPDGLSGEQIPLIARIMHVVDIFDALTSTRIYREAFDIERAMSILNEDAGRITDPRVTAVFVEAFRLYFVEQPEDYAQRFAHIPGTPVKPVEHEPAFAGAEGQEQAYDG
ncbi:MAG: HD-GYP domain-containing protein [Planctomycetes bacterium]|nr:HD-GYP domain-containing protein [Planctomycetota bacterium]